MTTCSIIIPVHNEADNLEKLLLKFWNNVGNFQLNIAEIHLVENGSKDDTYQICKKLEERIPGIVYAHKMQFASYGEAIKQGIMESSGDVVCILECDVMEISFLSESLSIIEKNKADFVVASKCHPDSIDLRSFKRKALTFLFNRWLKLFFDFPGSDTHGLKTIRSEVAKSLCEVSITGGEIFQTEIVLLAHKMGFRVKELPFCLKEVRNTKISIPRRIPKVINLIRDIKESLDRFPEKK